MITGGPTLTDLISGIKGCELEEARRIIMRIQSFWHDDIQLQRKRKHQRVRNFLILNGIKDKQIPKGYPQEQGKVEAYNKIVISEFLQIQELKDEKDGAEKYESFVNSYNYEREHGGINGMTPAEKFMKCLKQPLLIH